MIFSLQLVVVSPWNKQITQCIPAWRYLVIAGVAGRKFKLQCNRPLIVC